YLKQNYAEHKDARPLANVYASLIQEHGSDDAHKGQVQAWSLAYRRLVEGELNAVTAQKDHARLPSAIRLGQQYLQATSDDQTKESIDAKMARAYAACDEHKKAISIYMDLALNNNSPHKVQYLTLAAQSQSVLAKWPATTPWTAVPANLGPAKERANL